MKNLIPFVLLIFIIAACDTRQNQEGDADTTATSTEDRSDTTNTDEMATGLLEKAWETDTILTTSESVLYDEERNRLIVSNINGEPGAKDGNGFLTTLTLDGEVADIYFFSGSLDAPKGMGINENKLYVTDINRIVEIGLDDQISSNTWTIDTAQFLNDLAVGPDGTIYFSDSRTNTIYSLNDGNISTFLHSEELNGPNGLYVDDNNLMVTNMNGSQLLKVNIEDQSITRVADGIGAGDGVVPVGDGRFIASSWSGKVFLIDEDGNKKTILDTEGDNINSADIEYIQEENLLLVPTFRGNSVVAYKLNTNGEDQATGTN